MLHTHHTNTVAQWLMDRGSIPGLEDFSVAQREVTFGKSRFDNNPPRWPEVAAVVKKILYTYKKDARHWERVGDWVRAHRLAEVLRADRAAVHQVPHRQLARVEEQPQRLGAHPLLGARA